MTAYHLTKYEEIIGFPGSRAGVRSFLPFGFSPDVAHSIAKKIPCEQQALPRLPLSTNAPGQPDICPQGTHRVVRGRQRKGVAILLALRQTHSF